MSGKSRFLSTELARSAQVNLKWHGKDGMIGRKLQAIIAAHEHGIDKVSRIFEVTEKTLTSWIKKFIEGGASALLHAPRKTKDPLLNEQEKEQVHNWLIKDSSLTIKIVMEKIKNVFTKVVSTATAHRIMREGAMAYQTPRPRHYKADSHKQEEFKKNFKIS